MLNRRGLLIGIGALIAAPAIVRVESIMPVRAPRLLTMADILRAKASMIDRIDEYQVFLDPRQYADLLGRAMVRWNTVHAVGTYNGFRLVVTDARPDHEL